MQRHISLPETTVHTGVAEIAGVKAPYTLEVPAEVTDPRLMLVLNGYLGREFAYEGLRHELAERGRIVATVDTARPQSIGAVFDPRQYLNPLKRPGQAAWGVIKDIREKHEDIVEADQIDVAMHSMGHPVGVGLAEAHPGLVRNMIVVEGAGLEDHHATLHFPSRVRRFVNDELRPYVGEIVRGEHALNITAAEAARAEASYVIENGLWLAAQGLVVSNCYMRDRVIDLKEEQGIAVAAVWGEDDTLLPPEETIRHSWHIFDVGEVIEGGHLLPQRGPGRAAEAIVRLTSQL